MIKKKVLIVEPESSGHHLSLYVKLIVKSLYETFDIYLLTSVESKNHPSFITLINEYNNINTTFLPQYKKTKKTNSLSLLLNQCYLFFAIKKAFKKLILNNRIDHVYVSNLDHIDKAISLFGNPFGINYFSGMMMNPKFHKYTMGISSKSRNDYLYKFLFERLLGQKYLKIVNTVDETFSSYYNINPKVNFVPEPFDLSGHLERKKSRALFGFNDDNFIILVYGGLTKRKGIKELIDGFKLIKTNKVILLFVGKTNDETDYLFNEDHIKDLVNSGSLIIKKGFQSDEEQYNAFNSSDLVWVGYTQGFSGSSGVFYQAASIGIPVIVNNYGLLGWLVKKYENGISCDVQNPNSVKFSINNLIENKKLYTKLSANASKLALSHLPESFGNHIFKTIINT